MVGSISTENSNLGRERNGKCLWREEIDSSTHVSREPLSTERARSIQCMSQEGSSANLLVEGNSSYDGRT